MLVFVSSDKGTKNNPVNLMGYLNRIGHAAKLAGFMSIDFGNFILQRFFIVPFA